MRSAHASNPARAIDCSVLSFSGRADTECPLLGAEVEREGVPLLIEEEVPSLPRSTTCTVAPRTAVRMKSDAPFDIAAIDVLRLVLGVDARKLVNRRDVDKLSPAQCYLPVCAKMLTSRKLALWLRTDIARVPTCVVPGPCTRGRAD
jgi:hypothetical protein